MTRKNSKSIASANEEDERLYALRFLRSEAAYWQQPCYGPNEARIIRLEAIVEILVKALQIKGVMELEEVRREIAEAGLFSEPAPEREQ